FYRDLFGQIGARNFQVRPNVFRRRYANSDEGHAEGFELGFMFPAATGRAELQYTFMHAVGTASDAEGFPYGPSLTRRIDPVGEHPLDWDRRHSVTFLGEWRRLPRPPSTLPRGPVELATRVLRGTWSVSWVSRVGSALPWTPSPRRPGETNPSIINASRFKWEENTSFAVRWAPLV